MARPTRPTQKRKKVVHRRLPDYLNGSTAVAGSAVAAPVQEGNPSGPVTPSPRSARIHDFSYVKADLLRIAVIAAILVVLLVAIALASR